MYRDFLFALIGNLNNFYCQDLWKYGNLIIIYSLENLQ